MDTTQPIQPPPNPNLPPPAKLRNPNQTTFVVDAPCSAGKTTAAINFINQQQRSEEHFLYITPFLSEVQRIKAQCNFYEPVAYSKGKSVTSKMGSLQGLISRGKNIVSTHALFSRFNADCVNLSDCYNYTLILDEVSNVVMAYSDYLKDLDESLSVDEQKTILKECVDVQDDGTLKWKDNYTANRFKREENLCKLGCLSLYGDSVFIWLFPVSVFSAFKNVYVLTYMFEAQMQCLYYKYHQVNYQSLYVKGQYPSCQFTTESQIYNEHKFKDLIHAYDGNLNTIGDGDFSLSRNWFNNDKKNDGVKRKVLKDNTYNFFYHKMGTSSKFNMWTTFKAYKGDLSGNTYARGFIPCSARATNDFRHKTTLAYLMNRFASPIIKQFFKERGIIVNEELYALSELLQWVFRSQLRDGKPIDLYLPSRRMREILETWIESDTNSNGLSFKNYNPTFSDLNFKTEKTEEEIEEMLEF